MSSAATPTRIILILCVGLLLPTDAGTETDLYFSEIHLPVLLDHPAEQWIEIYNPTGLPTSFLDLSLAVGACDFDPITRLTTDCSSSSRCDPLFWASDTVHPSSFYVIAQGDPAESDFLDTDLIDGLCPNVPLSPSGDILTLLQSTGPDQFRVLDQVDFRPGSGQPDADIWQFLLDGTLAIDSGFSLSLFDPENRNHDLNDAPDRWCIGVADPSYSVSGRHFGSPHMPGLCAMIFKANFEVCRFEIEGFPDLDGDGFGDLNADAQLFCESVPNGFARNAMDCDDGDESIYPGNVELCDGLDNDCDPLTEDGISDPSIGMACDGVDSDLCAEGVKFCTAGSMSCSDTTGSTLDLCDGVDNDCDAASPDGSEDPGLGQQCDGSDSDLCMEGVSFCTGGTLSCADDTGDNLDICDGVDNDCDPASDDGSEDPGVGQICDGPDSDLCMEGVSFCTGGALSCTDETGDNLDLCDGVDNDCDAASPDGSEDPGLGQQCDGPDSDLCMEGLSFCTAGSMSCSDTTGSTLDLCDGVDNDCDPASDDGSEDPGIGQVCDGADSDLCNEGVTSCSTGALHCSDNTDDNLDVCDGADNDCDVVSADGDEDPALGQPCDGSDADLCDEGTLFCTAGSLNCSDTTPDNIELCNDEDDDCDGAVDEEFLPGGSVFYTGLDGLFGFKGELCGSGVCAGGSIICAINQVSLTCTTEDQASAEQCNGIDDDCDGQIDEGCE